MNKTLFDVKALWCGSGISSRGKTKRSFVEPGTKINSDYYINNILKPFLRQDVPRLFPGKEKINMVFHQDSPPSHTSEKTTRFLYNCKINYMKPEEWMPSSPDAAPMDYSVWGYLKQQLNKTEIKSLDELKKKDFYVSGQKSIRFILIKY